MKKKRDNEGEWGYGKEECGASEDHRQKRKEERSLKKKEKKKRTVKREKRKERSR